MIPAKPGAQRMTPSSRTLIRPWLFAVCVAAAPAAAWGAGAGEAASIFLWMAVLLLLAKLFSLVEKIGQPAVLGELVLGVLLGNIALAGVGVFEPIKSDTFIKFLAELGVIILLFQIGLESDVRAMRRVGVRAFLVACVGVAVPFVLGALVVGPLLFPGLDTNTYLFFGATLTATSVGITARVFKDMGALQRPEAQIVLGAAVIDDVIGLIILAVVSGIVTTGAVSAVAIAWITAKAFLFLGVALVAGQYTAPLIGRAFARIQTGVAMKFTLAIAFCFVLAYLAELIGLAPIVGAFAAGLILDEVTFRDYDDLAVVPDVRNAMQGADPAVVTRVERVLNKHAKHHLQSLLEPVGHLFIPLFFIYTGMQVDLRTLADLPTVGIALAVTALAFAGKLVSGLVAGPVRKWLVGWGMAPRGEVGLIFAIVGRELGVVDDRAYGVIVIMVMLTTLLTPVVLGWLLKRREH
jgi:Kef-type K+ transport system membrane component KefB